MKNSDKKVNIPNFIDYKFGKVVDTQGFQESSDMELNKDDFNYLFKQNSLQAHKDC